MEQTTLFIHFSQGLQHVIHVLLLQHGHHGLLQRQLLVLLQILQHADQRLVLTRLPLAYRNRHKRILGIPNVIIEDVSQSSGKEEREELVDGIEALSTVTALSSTNTKSGTSRSSTNPADGYRRPRPDSGSRKAVWCSSQSKQIVKGATLVNSLQRILL